MNIFTKLDELLQIHISNFLAKLVETNWLFTLVVIHVIFIVVHYAPLLYLIIVALLLVVKFVAIYISNKKGKDNG